MFPKKFIIPSYLVALLCTGQASIFAGGFSLGINFGADEPNGANSGTLAAELVAGAPAFAQPNWNNVTTKAGTVENLNLDNSGLPIASSAAVTWTSPNTWSSTGRGEENNQFAADSGDRLLMLGYLDTGNATTTTVDITNIPAELASAGYDVVVYALGGVSGRGGGYQLRATDDTPLADPLFGDAPANPTKHAHDIGASHRDTGTFLVLRVPHGLTSESIRVAASTANGWGAGGTPRASLNALQLVPHDPRPVITFTSPSDASKQLPTADDAALSFNWLPTTQGLEFTVTDDNAALVAGSLVLTVDGVVVSPTVTAGGGIAVVSYSPVAPWANGSHHTAVLKGKDNEASARDIQATVNFSIDPIGEGTLFIEAEDFNYSDDDGISNGGQHANFGDPDASLKNKNGIQDVDYHDPGANEQQVYRALTGVATGKLGTDNAARGANTITENYILGWNDAGDWYNYTRDFGPAQKYKVYGRFASGGADEHAILSKVKGDVTTPDQTTLDLGHFDSEATHNWDLFDYVPLRNSKGEDAVLRLGGVTTLRFTVLPGNVDYNYLAFVPTAGPTLRPSIATASPVPDSTFNLRDPLVKVLVLDGETAVKASTLKLSIDGAAVAGTAVDTDDGAEISFKVVSRFAPGSFHTATVSFTDDDVPTADAQSFTWSFNVQDFTSDTLFVEAEDFNFSDDDGATNPGQHPEFGDANGSLLGKNGMADVDYHDPGGNEQKVYRALTGVAAGKLGTDFAQRGLGVNNSSYIVGWNDAGDWFNYTRTFPAGNGPVAGVRYNIYGRFASGGADEHGKLDLVTSDPTAGDQTVEPLGNFDATATHNWDLFHSVPLRNSSGELVSVRLNGSTTVRLTVLPGNIDINYLAFVPADLQVIKSTLVSAAPAKGTYVTHAPEIKVVLHDEDSKVKASSIRLTVDGVNVTGTATITDTDNGAEIRYNEAVVIIPINHNATIEWADEGVAGTQTYSWSWGEAYNTDNLFIEAEDFNHDGGQSFADDFSNKGLYDGLSGTHLVDYAQPGGGNDSDKYRKTESPNVNITEINDANRTGAGDRLGFDTISDFKIGWNDVGDWYNYTRNFPKGKYHPYARLSSGGADIHADLSRVTSDPTQGDQKTVSLGTFDASATGNWDGFVFVPLRKNGEEVTLDLDGPITLRLSVLPGNFDYNYMMFVPDAPRPRITVGPVVDGKFTLTYPAAAGVLQSAPTVLGPWKDVVGAAGSLNVDASKGTTLFYSLRAP